MSASRPAAAHGLPKPPSDLVIQLFNAGCTTYHGFSNLEQVVVKIVYDEKGRFKHKTLPDGWSFESSRYLRRTLGPHYASVMRVLFEVRDVSVRPTDDAKGVAMGYRPLYDLKSVLAVLKPQAALYKGKKPGPPARSVTYTIKSSDVPHNPHPQLNDSDMHAFTTWLSLRGSFYRDRTNGGRVYEDCGGLQCMSKAGLKALFGGTGAEDVDMTSAHPRFLHWIIGAGVSPFLDAWLHDPTLLCPGGILTPEIKKDVHAVLNGLLYPRTSVGMLAKRDMPNIIRALRASGHVTGTWGRGSMFRILERLERRALDVMVATAQEHGCTVMVLKHDGLILHRNGVEDIRQKMEAALESAFPGGRIRLAVKAKF